MSRFAIVLAGALCLLFLAQLTAASENKVQHIVQGAVYCDICRANFPNQFSKPMPRAVVKLECRADLGKGKVTYSVTSDISNDDGEYQIVAEGDHKGEYCAVTLVKSSQHDCAEIVPDDSGRMPAAEVILTNNNNLPHTFRDVEPLTFSPKEKAPECKNLKKLKKKAEEDDAPLPIA